MVNKEKAEISQEQPVESKYTKKQLIDSKRFAHRADILNVILEDGKEYSIPEAEEMLEKFMKGKVK